MIENDPAVLAEIEPLFARYEQALGDNNIDFLDAIFARSPHTVRYGMGEHLYGFDEIAEFRRKRPGGSPPRKVLRRTIATYGKDFATTHVEFQRIGSDRVGRQTQSWARLAAGWRIVSAHVSMMVEHS